MNTERIANYTDRILATYDAADPRDVAAGHAWYSRAEATINGLADTYGVSRETAAGVVATLSPSVRWSRNVKIAEKMLAAAVNGEPEPVVDGYGRNRAKAWKIANGADPDAVVSGPKVSAFYANLTGDPNRVTVDRWAIRAAGVEFPDGKTASDGLMAEVGEAYRQAARRRGVTPRDIQAAVWVAVRGGAE